MSKNVTFVSSAWSPALLALCLAFGQGCSNDTSGTEGSSGGSTGSSASSASGGSSSASVSSGGKGGSSSASESAGGGGSSKAGSTASGGKSTAAGGSSGGDATSSSDGKGGTGGGTGTGTGTATGGTGTGGTGKTGGTTGAGGTTAKTGGTSGGGGATGGTGAGGTGGSTGAPGGAKQSDGCGKDPPTLKSAPAGQASPVNTISGSRQFLVRLPTNYDNKKAYPLHIGLHGANGDLAENGKDNFGLWSLAKDTVIFATLAGVNKLWDGPRDLTYTDEVLKKVESELCIDTSRIFLEGFSMGAAMSWYLTGSRPGVFRAVVGHSGGGVGGTPALSPVAYWGSLGTGESGNSQKTQTDQFAKANGCTIDTLPTATTGKHVCTPYKGCKEGFPVTWCSFDGGHGFVPKDSGASTTWVPQAVWDFLKPLL